MKDYLYYLVLGPCNASEANLVNSELAPSENPSLYDNPSKVQGLVQFCLNATRTVICDDSLTFSDAKVACRSLGYSPYGNIIIVMCVLDFIHLHCRCLAI